MMKAFSRTWWLRLLMLLPAPAISFAQAHPPLRFEQLTVKEGLSHSFVTCALQDRDGFMWFGTRYGLNKYDGYTFTTFQSDPNDPAHSLQHNYIKTLHEDQAGRLWVTTQGGGLHEVNKRTGKITAYALLPLRDNPANTLYSFYEDRRGLFWLGSTAGFLRFNPRTKQFTKFFHPKLIQVRGEDAAGQLWAHSRSALYRA